MRGIIGLAALIGLAWLLSSDKRRFPWRLVIVGVVMQWVLAWLVLRTETGQAFFDLLGQFVTLILEGADAGASFVFGELAGSNSAVAWKAIAGIKILTTIIVVASLSSIGYHYGVLQRVVSGLAWIMKWAMGVSGAESLSGAANVFFGQTEAPLLVRPYISGMTRSELMALMTGGFATVASGVLAVYVIVLAGNDTKLEVQTARHLLTASLMSAPAAFVMAKVMIPETGVPQTLGTVKLELRRETHSLVDAVTQGASSGMSLAINVVAMLIAFIALIAVLDSILVAIGNLPAVAPWVQSVGLARLDLNGLLGLLFWPVAWAIGVEPSDCHKFAGLLGEAMATNELIAYSSLAKLIHTGGMSQRSLLMATYSICGFANFSSIGIQIGGIGVLAPDRRRDLVELGPRAMLGGAMACWSTGCVAGIFLT